LCTESGRVDEPALVAGEQADHVALLHTELGERVRHRVRTAVDLVEGQRPALVDDADRGGHPYG